MNGPGWGSHHPTPLSPPHFCWTAFISPVSTQYAVHVFLVFVMAVMVARQHVREGAGEAVADHCGGPTIGSLWPWLGIDTGC